MRSRSRISVRCWLPWGRRLPRATPSARSARVATRRWRSPMCTSASGSPPRRRDTSIRSQSFRVAPLRQPVRLPLPPTREPAEPLTHPVPARLHRRPHRPPERRRLRRRPLRRHTTPHRLRRRRRPRPRRRSRPRSRPPPRVLPRRRPRVGRPSRRSRLRSSSCVTARDLPALRGLRSAERMARGDDARVPGCEAARRWVRHAVQHSARGSA